MRSIGSHDGRNRLLRQGARDIHANPMKRFLVTAGADYPYWSAHSGFELDAPPQRLKALSECAPFGIAKAMP